MKKLMMVASLTSSLLSSLAGCSATTQVPAADDTDAGPDATPVEPCTPNAFLGCEGTTAKRCGADGLSIETTACDSGCNAAAERCNECAPGVTSCAGDQLETCGTDGLVASTETCSLGCSTERAEARCAHIVPHYLPNVCDGLATIPTKTFPAGQANVLDTNLTSNCTGGVLPQPGGPEVCVVRAGTISVDGPLEVIGNRAIAFVADDALDVDNILDVSARRRFSGPGGGKRSSGAAPSGGGGGSGGGGAGGKQAGGGGGSSGNILGGAAGAVFDPFVAQVFDGGAKSSSLTQIGNNYRPTGGGGGGAVMLVSCRGEVRMAGTIEAGGGGGDGGGDGVASSTLFTVHGGAGGGAGGYAVLQGAKVTVTGQLFANGGGGGGGCSTDGCVGAAGEDGARVTARGGAGLSFGGRGGNGGFDATTPQRGTDGDSPGGGGGSVGRFQIFTPAGVTPVNTATSQPAFEPNRTISTR